jgi:hypothetical protein
VRRPLLYAQTLRHLRARQLVAQASRRLIPRRAENQVPEFAGFSGLTPLRPFVVPAFPATSSGSITFLNQTRAFDPHALDWCDADMPKLWHYNLHYFDKPGGSQRGLSIPSFEDKVAQRAIVMLIEPIYEQHFLDCSFGYRPNRSAHQARRRAWRSLRSAGSGTRIAQRVSVDATGGRRTAGATTIRGRRSSYRRATSG